MVSILLTSELIQYIALTIVSFCSQLVNHGEPFTHIIWTLGVCSRKVLKRKNIFCRILFVLVINRTSHYEKGNAITHLTFSLISLSKLIMYLSDFLIKGGPRDYPTHDVEYRSTCCQGSIHHIGVFHPEPGRQHTTIAAYVIISMLWKCIP